MNDILIGLVIFVFLVLIILCLIIFFRKPPAVQQPPGQFLQPCVAGTTVTGNGCQSPLSCDASSGICKYTANQPCTRASDCVAPLFCSGLCVSGNTGNIGDYCPCNEGNSCVSDITTGLNTCKGNADVPCTNNNQCASNFCAASSTSDNPCPTGSTNCVCRGGLPLAAVCTSNDQCESNNCSTETVNQISTGYCQPPNVTTGTVGSFCTNSTCPGFSGAQCNPGLSCLCNGQNQGVCNTTENGLLSPCSLTTVCPSPMICETTTETNGSCNFGSNAAGPPCIFGMGSPGSGCFNNTNITCAVANNCLSSICSQPAGLSTYLFSTGAPPNTLPPFTMSTNFPLAESVALQGINPYTAGLTPYKIFFANLASPTLDDIYLVDANLGLLYTQYDTVNQNVTTPWIVLLTKDTGVGTLIDATIDSAGNLYLAINDSGNTVIYQYQNLSFIQYNGGIQFDTNNVQLSADYIDISTAGDFLLANATTGVIYTKSLSATQYTALALVAGGFTAGTPRFYTPAPAPVVPSENAVIYINNNNLIVNNNIFTTPATNFNIDPTIDFSNGSGSLIVLDTNNDPVVGVRSGPLFANLPGKFSAGCLSLVTNNAFYIIGPNSCT